MGRVLTNTTAMAYVLETELNVPGTDWHALEPNDITSFGAEISTVSRSPISRNRQQLKGIITDLDSSVDFETDLTMSAFRDFIAGFCFSIGVNSNVTQIKSTSVVSDAYTVQSLNAEQAEKLKVGTLLWITGGVNDGNNGLKQISVDAVLGDTQIQVIETLIDETADFRVSFTGYKSLGPTWTWDPIQKQATLAATGIGTELGGLGLLPGEVVHIGSISASGEDTILNGFDGNTMVGYARCIILNTDTVVFDRVDVALQSDDLSPETRVDIIFGEFFRNVPTDHDDFTSQSFQFEIDYSNLGIDGSNRYHYSKGNYCNVMTIDIPIGGKAGITYGFIGTDSRPPGEIRNPDVDPPLTPTQIKAFNTSSDIVRLRVLDTDDNGLTTDFKSLKITVNNNVTAEKVIATLGARYLNIGNFGVEIEAQLMFTSPELVDRIRCNDRTSMDFVFNNEDGTIAFDVPSMTIGDGSITYPVNESVMINTTSTAYVDPVLNTSLGVSIFPMPFPNADGCSN